MSARKHRKPSTTWYREQSVNRWEGRALRNLKKEKGVIGELLPSLITVMVIAVLLLFFINLQGNADRKNAVDQLARQYILRMETCGYLTAQDRDALRTELEYLGCQGLDFTGTTLSPAGYGNRVNLVIRGRIPVHTLGITDVGAGEAFFGVQSGKKELAFEVHKASIGKY
jgi:hypothetical protein